MRLANGLAALFLASSLSVLFTSLLSAGPIFEAFAGAEAGNGEAGSGTIVGTGSAGNGQNCTTYGPAALEISPNFSNGFGTPEGGIGPCNYYGGAFDNMGVTSQSAATGLVSASFPHGNTFSGSASASSSSAANGEFALNANASSTYLGATSGTTLDGASSAAAASDPNWVISCLTCSAGENLIPVFTWTYTTSITTNQNYVYQADLYGDFGLQLEMDFNNEGTQDAFAVNFNGGTGEPYWTCYYNPVCPSFTLGPGSMSGTSTFTFVPYNQSVNLGAGNTVTVDEAVSLAVQTESTATVDPNAVLTGVTWVTTNIYGDVLPVNGVTLTTSTGTYTASGYSAFSSSVPEPASWLLCALGLGAVLARGRRFSIRR